MPPGRRSCALRRSGTVAALAAAVLGALLLLSPAKLHAQDIQIPGITSASAPAGEPVPESDIAADDPPEDPSIASRIEGIFAEIEGLRGVQVRVQSGVVTLSGEVTNEADRAKAEAIAARISGVVTVENAIARTFEVDSNLSPVVATFRDDLRGLVRAVPLFGVALLIGMAIAGLAYLLAGQERLWRWVAPNNFLAELIGGAIRIIGIIAGLVVALQVLGATALLGLVLGSAGVIGIALGFAVRDTVDNYVSSLMLSLRQPFRANDHVVIGESEGRVIRLTSRATILMTLDGNHLRIPNAIVFRAIILNYARNPQRRFDFDLGIDSDDDPLAAMHVAVAAMRKLPFVLASPGSHAVIHVVGDSSIVLRFFGWIDQRDTDFLKGRSLSIHAAKQALEREGFVLPEPIYRLRIDERGAVPRVGELAELGEPAPPEPRRVRASALPVEEETEPDCAVEQLVSDEREDSRETDLLDPKKPIE